MADKLLVQVVIEGEKGGAGSGNHGHRGIPGKLGGSAPKGGAGGPSEMVKLGGGSQTFKIAGKVQPVIGPNTAVVAARQSGEISKDWKTNHSSNIATYSRKLANGDALEVGHGQGGWTAVKYTKATDSRSHIGDAGTQLDAIKLAERSLVAKAGQGKGSLVKASNTKLSGVAGGSSFDVGKHARTNGLALEVNGKRIASADFSTAVHGLATNATVKVHSRDNGAVVGEWKRNSLGSWNFTPTKG